MPPSSNTIALVAVVGSTSTAIAVPLLNGLYQAKSDRRRYRNEQEAKDLDELRALLDHVAQTAFEFTRHLVTLENLAAEDRRPLGERRHVLAEMRSTLYAANGRLVIRRSRKDRVVVALGAWLASVDQALAEIDLIWGPRGGEPFAYTEEQLAVLAHEHWGTYEAFLDAAQALVGSTLAGQVA
ncbi:MAG: hypothetical protein ACTHOE_15405 [Conexibacter sp.]